MDSYQSMAQELLSNRDSMSDIGLEKMYDFFEELVSGVFEKIDIKKLGNIFFEWEEINEVVSVSEYEDIFSTAWEQEVTVLYGDGFLLNFKKQTLHSYPEIVRRVKKIGSDIYQARNTPFCPSTDTSLNCEKCQINELCKIKE